VGQGSVRGTNAHNDAKRNADRAVEESRREIADHYKQRAAHVAKLAADKSAFDQKMRRRSGDD